MKCADHMEHMLDIDPTENRKIGPTRSTLANNCPGLVSDLVRRTLPNPPTRRRFPGGSSVGRPGWDGLVTVRCGNTWVPDGNSGWELSCERTPKGKASEVYKSRTEDPLGEDPDDTTFVFLTPRKWDKSWEWVKEKKAGPWAGVRVLDVDDLLEWVKEAPEIAIRLATWIRKPFLAPPREVWGGLNRIDELFFEHEKREESASYRDQAAFRQPHL